jgi:hypothetical protein
VRQMTDPVRRIAGTAYAHVGGSEGVGSERKL